MNKVTRFLSFMFVTSILASSATYPMDGGMNDPALLEGLLTKQDINADRVITIIGFLSGVSTVGFSFISKGGSMLFALATVNPALFFSLFTTGGLLYKAYMIIKLRRAVDKIGEDVEEIKVTVQNTNEKVTTIESDVLDLKRGQAEQTGILNKHGEKLQDVGDQVTGLQKQLGQHHENTDNRFNNIDEALQANKKTQDARDEERKQRLADVERNQSEKLDAIRKKIDSSLISIVGEITVIKTDLQGNTKNMNVCLGEMSGKFKRASLKLSNLQEDMSTLQSDIKKQAKQFPKLAEDMCGKFKEQEDQIKELYKLVEQERMRHEKQMAAIQHTIEQGGQVLQNGQYHIDNKLSRLLQQQQQQQLRWSDPNSSVYSKNQQRGSVSTIYVYGFQPKGVNTSFLPVQNCNAITDGSEKNRLNSSN